MTRFAEIRIFMRFWRDSAQKCHAQGGSKVAREGNVLFLRCDAAVSTLITVTGSRSQSGTFPPAWLMQPAACIYR